MPPWFGSAELGIWVEFIGKCDKALIEEFLSPPDDTSRGKMGELVFALSGKTYRLPVEQNLNKETALGDSGWKVSLKSYSPRMSKAEPGDPPEMPMVRAKVISPEGKSTNYAIASRLVMYPGPLDSFETPVDELPEGLPAVWYHPPDLRYSYNGQYSGRPHMKSVLQFVQSTDNRLFYRSLQEQGDKLQIESAGMAPPSGVSRNVWEKYAGSFLIEEHLPHAKPCLQRIIPLAKRPGLFSEETPPAVLGRLTLSKKTADGEIKKYTAERWFDLGRTQRLTISGTHDGTSFNEPLEVSYSYRTLQLPFEIELIRAESLVDPGTNSPATYSSFVKLYDAERNIHGEDHHITMNEPLNHRGFKIYQSQFSNAGLDPETMEPIARSGFTVGRDPGLWLKYLGTAMLGIGIATMYYMRAYNPRNLLRVISLSTQ
ncbi:MAG TPA: cytochrome c biogenesis protein ResB, partial [Gemmatales bacterium]|nr:cytochrome c biogenesis protein ResB [Gemmatales bacterium]